MGAATLGRRPDDPPRASDGQVLALERPRDAALDRVDQVRPQAGGGHDAIDRADLDGALDAVDRVELRSRARRASRRAPRSTPRRAPRAGARARRPRRPRSARRARRCARPRACGSRPRARTRPPRPARRRSPTRARPRARSSRAASLSRREKTTNAPPWKREMTQKAIGPSKLTIARPISAPYSSCSRRIDSGEPSKPARLASTTSGRRPDAALIARAILREDCGNSVPAVHCSGPSAGTGAEARQRARLDAEQRDRPPAEARVPHDRVLGLAHARPALERLDGRRRRPRA